MAIESIQDLFLDELRDLYSAEKQATRAYPKLVKASSTQELKDALQTHMQETQGQIERLERVFEILGKKPTGKTCEGMKGLIAEANETLQESGSGPIRDAALIGAAQRVEHYEMAGYGTVVAFAKSLGQTEIVGLLNETLNEEKLTDKKLTGISKIVNKQAITESEAAEEQE